MKYLLPSLRAYLILTLLLGVAYPVLVTGISQLLFPAQSNGSLLFSKDGHIIGSEIIAQRFTSPKYFWPRPSTNNYNPLASGGSNLGPISETLLNIVNERKAQGFTGDMLFASASGLDPHISPESAMFQLERVASYRSIPQDDIRDLVFSATEGRDLGLLGERRVNVLRLNLALDQLVMKQ